MIRIRSYTGFFTFLIGMLFLCLIFNLSLGSVDIPLWEAIKITLGYPTTKPTFEYILLDYRIPKVILSETANVFEAKLEKLAAFLEMANGLPDRRF